MKKMLFIMNPVAGMRKGAKFLPDILSLYNRAGYETLVYMTGGPGDARPLVEEKAKDVDIIVCCGGDGTFNEIASGLINSGVDIPIGYIPAGSTNDFANSLKLSTNIMEAAQDVLRGVPTAYDVGSFGGRYFSYVASFGMFTRTSYATPQSFKNTVGHMAYLLSSIQELSQIRKYHVRMELDDQVVEDDFLFGAVCNSTTVAGVLTLSPDRVDLADGLMEVMLIREPRTIAEVPEAILALQTQQYDNCPLITFTSTRNARIYAEPDMIWTLDGEREDGHAEIEVRNLHKAIRVIRVPEGI